MISELSRASEARMMLKYFEPAKEGIFEVLRKRQITKNTKDRLDKAIELVKFCDRSDDEIGLMRFLISHLAKNEIPESKDLTKALEILDICKSDLLNYINEEFGVGSPISQEKKDEFEEDFSSLKSTIYKRRKRLGESRKILVRDVIFDRPGLYIELLTDALQSRYGEMGFSYPTVWGCINELVEEKWILTVGGPQGAYRYCFPHPNKVKNRSKYYGSVFAIEGGVEERVTNLIDLPKMPKFYEIYLVNAHLNQKTLMLTDYNAPIEPDDITIRAYGDLQPFKYLTEKMTHISQKSGLKTHDILLARKIAKIENGKEKELWFDRQKGLLFSPQTLPVPVNPLSQLV